MAVTFEFTPPDEAPLVVRRAAVALCVGELDPTGRHGLLADMRALASIAVRGAVVPTFVSGLSMSPESLVETWDHVRGDLPIDAIKIGRLGGERAVRVLAERLEDAAHPRVVVDPGFLDPYGEPRISDAVALAWRTHILPHALIVSVNLIEAWRLFGRRCEDRRAMLEAAHRLRDLGPKWVVITGGRLEGHPVDLAYDGTGSVELGADRISGNRLPHTGGTFTALLTGLLARGLSVPAALERARAAVNPALAGASPLLEHGAAIEPMASIYTDLGLDPLPISVVVPQGPRVEGGDLTP